MNLRKLCCLCYALLAWAVPARTLTESCGTYPGNWREDIDHHEKIERRLAALPKSARQATPARRLADIGNVAVIESDDSIFARRNPFNLDRSQITFTPSAGRYAYATTTASFDQNAADSGIPVTGLGDDDSRRLPLPFSFPFYGTEYTEFWLNSDGNITFGEGDNASTARSLGRLSGGPPRIAALFSDLDPSILSGSIRIAASPAAITLTWQAVPEYSDFGTGRPQTFQLRLTPDGQIRFVWNSVSVNDAVVGISPGATLTRPLLASFLQNPAGSHDAMIAERFGEAQALDRVSAARRFYETHDDAYDYLAFFNATGIQAGAGVLADEVTVRTARRGIGDTAIDIGRTYGSPARLQAILNMGPVSNFPANPNSPHPLRFSTGDTGLTVLAHELGHLFLAFSSIRTPGNPAARPMLGRQLFHWNFRFNSEASILEGNRIRDDGPTASPRFTTTATVEGFSPLDQYLMGLRAPEDVPPTFLVENASTTQIDPRPGVRFDGDRRDITVDDLIAVDGPRIPSHTLEQRRFRMAIVLIVPPGGAASPSELALLERYKEEIEAAWPRYTGGRGALDATLRRAVRLSIEPAAGALTGFRALVEATLQQPPADSVTFSISAAGGLLEGPSTLTIPGGARSATATFNALRPGVATLRLEPVNSPDYAPAEARLQVSAPASVVLKVLSGDRQIASPGVPLPNPIVVKLTDANDLPYANVRIAVTGGTVSPATAVTGADGQASFRWTPSADPANRLRFTLEGAPQVAAEAIALGKPAFSAASVVNAASFQPGITPGAIATIFGINLAQPQVAVDGTPANVFFANDGQVNFAVPQLTQTSASVSLQLTTPLGSTTATVPLLAVQPGIFFDSATGRAAAIDRGSRIFELYGTGFQPSVPVTALAGGLPAEVLFSGAAPGFPGLHQINIRVDTAVPSGDQPLSLRSGGAVSNDVKLAIAP
jgi:uncharacterized protein (TIGR03437 family)